jgi:hypothetical protein
VSGRPLEPRDPAPTLAPDADAAVIHRAEAAGGRDLRRARRQERRRRLGLGLIAFGVSGVVLVGSAALLVLASLSAVDDAATGFERQRAEILAMLGPASDSLAGAADSAANAGASLAETRDAATSAARLTTRLAESFEGMASLGTVEIFGTRPFAAMAGQFTAVAVESRTLSADLEATALSMDTNIADSAAVAENLRALAGQLDALEASLGAGSPAPGASAAPSSSPPAGGPGLAPTSSALPIAAARFVLMGLLAWLAIPAIASIWIGWRWSRPASEV